MNGETLGDVSEKSKAILTTEDQEETTPRQSGRDTESQKTSKSQSKKIRRDAFGTPITTVIGSYSKPKAQKKADDKAGEGGEPVGRHKITFTDQLEGDDSKLFSKHIIERYKGTDQEIMTTQPQGCCTIF